MLSLRLLAIANCTKDPQNPPRSDHALSLPRLTSRSCNLSECPATLTGQHALRPVPAPPAPSWTCHRASRVSPCPVSYRHLLLLHPFLLVSSTVALIGAPSFRIGGSSSLWFLSHPAWPSCCWSRCWWTTLLPATGAPPSHGERLHHSVAESIWANRVVNLWLAVLVCMVETRAAASRGCWAGEVTDRGSTQHRVQGTPGSASARRCPCHGPSQAPRRSHGLAVACPFGSSRGRHLRGGASQRARHDLHHPTLGPRLRQM